ncbi:MAG: response regulator, partial [Bacteroidota bacterium]
GSQIAIVIERKQAEEEIKLKNEQLQKSNAEKDKFFSIIAHDLRGPFNGLLGLTRLLTEELPTMTQDQIKKCAVTMRKSATKLYSLLENLLEWSMLQRGLISFKPESFILLNGIAPIIELYRDAADKKMIRLDYEVPEDLRVLADKRMFDSLMRNLVFNAVKFTPKGGKINITAKPRSDFLVEISIKDTGIGMNKHTMDTLFLLDEQDTRKGTEGEPSTGLGLIISRDFIEKHGGKIWVESEEGKGSTFYFTIPYNAEAQGRSDTTDASSQILAEYYLENLTILIAEDEETSELLITSMLKKISHKVIHTRTGAETVEACRNNPDIELVLMDIRMPGMNGYEATRQIRQFNTDVVIIAQTAYGLQGDREKAIKAGCNDYISKPIDKDELFGLIQKYFRK